MVGDLDFPTPDESDKHQNRMDYGKAVKALEALKAACLTQPSTNVVVSLVVGENEQPYVRAYVDKKGWQIEFLTEQSTVMMSRKPRPTGATATT